MLACRILTKTLVMAFFAINAWNMFNNAPAESESFKKNLAAFEDSLKTRVWTGYQNQASNLLKNHALSVVYYGALAQLVFSLLGAWCSWSSSIAALIFFTFQVIAQNFAKIDWRNCVDLERYALPVSLFVSVLAISCCKKDSCSTRQQGKHKSGSVETHTQASQKKRH